MRLQSLALRALLLVVAHLSRGALSASSSHDPNPLSFELRHFHATAPDTHVTVFQDVPPSFLHLSTPYEVTARPIKVHRPTSQYDLQAARELSMRKGQSRHVGWEPREVLGPDVTDRETLLSLAKMTNDAYFKPSDNGWYDLGPGWNTVRSSWKISIVFHAPIKHQSYSIGWEGDVDGFRGHVFATPDNSTVVLSIKGTSGGSMGSGGPTSAKDKLNDNLLWSCCCARVDWTWSTVCGCYAGPGLCDSNCVEDALTDKSLFYPVGTVHKIST